MQGYISEISDRSTPFLGKQKAISVLFSGCNFRCPWCFTPDILDFKQEYLRDLKDVKKEIRDICPGKKYIIFSGGEPLLQKASLTELCSFAKSLGLKTCIETNASKFDALQHLLKSDLLDSIYIDIKTPFDDEHFERATQSQTFFISNDEILSEIKKSLKILKEYEDVLDIEIRTIIIPSITFRKEDILEIAKEIKDLRCVWKIQSFIPGDCLSKQIEKIEPPSERFLENLAEFCQSRYPQLRIEVGTENEPEDAEESILY